MPLSILEAHLLNRNNHASQWLLSSWVNTSELGTKVVECRTKLGRAWVITMTEQPDSNIPEQPMRLSSNKVYSILVSPVIDLELLAERYISKHNNLVRY
jgi:hypothetical protein